MSLVSAVRRLGTPPWPTPGPFLFLVYHKDLYPEGDEKARAPRRGNGADFDPSAPYRMYHGERVPGFPKHPHRGFETVTAVMEGVIDHADSMGAGGRYGNGDLQWMTAGRGIQHSEMFPLVRRDAPNTLRLFQIWLNLEKKSKMVPPRYVMHWNHQVPRIKSEGSQVTVWAGRWGDATGLPPPSDSYAASEEHEVAIYLVELQPGGKVVVPTASAKADRQIYFYEGDGLSAGETALPAGTTCKLNPTLPAELRNTGNKPASILVLQGRPINEPIAQSGPFVMNTQQEIRQAFIDYQRTSFGSWPYADDSPVHPLHKGRFATIDGKEDVPPDV
eukprot:Hpha_TRINITY_DN6246_c0_g1::TRINITY_DN6246_c0_g1_i1::g.23530::m.23530/K06911/K06911; uncharacterized protein